MIRDVIREALASGRSQPVATAVTVLVVFGMVLAVMLTTGRTVGAEQQVLGTLDSAGTRSIVIQAEGTAGVTSDILERIQGIDGIEWAGAFSAASDGTNASFGGGSRVPVRTIYTNDVSPFGISPTRGGSVDSSAWASPSALDQLGMREGVGGLELTAEASVAVVGELRVPSFLTAWEPFVLVPDLSASGAESVSVVVVIADRPDLVPPVSEALLSVIAADDPSKISMQTSEGLANLRDLIEGQLGTFSRGLVLALLALTGTLVAVLLYGLVLMRRRDFGRRRALGASRGLIIALILTQTGILAAVGVAAGLAAATMLLVFTGDPLPGPAFTAAIAVLAVSTALLAAVVPAVVASKREPIRELRVP